MTVETKMDEIRYTTSDPKKMLGKYLPNSVVKTWVEDFMDADTGEVVSIDRTEVLFNRGTLITQDVLAQIQFSMAAGEITEVEVSNQRRLACEAKNTSLYPFTATVVLRGRNVKFLLYAQGVENVLEILRDYIELNFSDNFAFSQIKVMNHCVILNDTLRSMGEKGTEEDECVKAKRFFQLDLRVSFKDDDSDDDAEKSVPATFIVNTIDVEHALNAIQLYLNNEEQKTAEKYEREHREYAKREFALSIEKAGPYAVNYFVPKEFSEVYSQQ